MMRHGTVTVTATAQSLAAALGEDMQLYFVSLQPFAANSGVVFHGGAGVTTTNYGGRLEIPVSSVPSAPWFLDAIQAPALKLGDIYVVGTANDKISIEWIPRV